MQTPLEMIIGQYYTLAFAAVTFVAAQRAMRMSFAAKFREARKRMFR